MPMIRLQNEADYAMPGRDDQPESLLLALAALLGASGRKLDYDDLAGGTGVGLLFTWIEGQDCPCGHVRAGRSIALAGSADLLGLIFRPLDAAPLGKAHAGGACPTFEDHFHDSYAPLLTAALVHGQPILCEGGWPDDAGGSGFSPWGVLTRASEELADRPAPLPPGAAPGFGGWTMGVVDGPAWLVRPPRRVFILETVLPQEPRSDELLSHGLRMAASWSAPPADPAQDRGFLVGSAAMDRWAERLATARPFCAQCGEESWRCCLRLGRFLRAGRVSAYEFLCRHGEGAAREFTDASQLLEPLLSEQIELCERLVDAGVLAGEFARSGGQVRLAAEVARLADLERHVEQALAPLG